VLPGFGHVGLGGSFGWAIPEEGLAVGFVHNRLLTPLVATDQTNFVGTGALVRLGAASARKRGFAPVTEFGAAFPSVTAAAAG
jgi:CubicO group peptidase (beta-lactamase class C family)